MVGNNCGLQHIEMTARNRPQLRNTRSQQMPQLSSSRSYATVSFFLQFCCGSAGAEQDVAGEVEGQPQTRKWKRQGEEVDGSKRQERRLSGPDLSPEASEPPSDVHFENFKGDQNLFRSPSTRATSVEKSTTEFHRQASTSLFHCLKAA
jgi:hypothetical protein